MKTRKAVLAISTIVAMTVPVLTACGGANDTNTNRTSQAPYGNDIRTTQPRKGMSAGKKAAMLAGAAALYYLYNKNKEQRQADKSVPQYYLSSNGHVYYRDADKKVHWVKAPAGGIEVSQQEAARYRDFQGYEGRSDGRGLAGLSKAPNY